MKEYIFRKAQHEELEECTALANLAFKVDFRTLLPKVYGENPPMWATHYVADNGELKGLVLDGGTFVGYVVTYGDKSCWTEVCVQNTDAFDRAVKAWMTQNQPRELQIILPEWEGGLRRHLAGYASGMSRGYSVQARIFRFKRVAEAYLKVRAHNGGISDGRMAFDIDGERFEITVENGNVSVSEGGENPFRMTACEANRLMLLPFPVEDMPMAPKDWFPLGISVAPDAPDAF